MGDNGKRGMGETGKEMQSANFRMQNYNKLSKHKRHCEADEGG
jgi:hypothetical protein